MHRNALLDRLRLSVPIIQAPMAGGGDTPELVAEVCNAGAIGFIGAAYLTPERIAAACAEVRSRTGRPFGINLFAPQPLVPRPPQAERALDRLRPYYDDLGVAPPGIPDAMPDPFPAQLAAALDSGAAAFSFTFGMLPADAVAAIHERGMALLGTATTVDEAKALEASGVDAVIAQGAEAGGHRGSFLADAETGLVGLVALVPQVVDAVRVPVVASGGIMDGRGVAAALALGACAVQLGTVFLGCDEAGVAPAYKRAMQDARECDTRITRAFSGRSARGIVNRVLSDAMGAPSDTVLPFPWQNALTRPMRTAAAAAGRAEFLSLWAGQGVGMARREPARDTVARLTAELEATLARLRS